MLKFTSLLLHLQFMVEEVRLQYLREKGYYPTPILPSDSRAKALSGLLSTSYYTILEFHNLHVPTLMRNVVVLATYATSLPGSWFTFDLLETIRATLESGSQDSSFDPLALFTLLLSHANLGTHC
jgi:hypothetical protein